jgi:predicted outer membrane repeat protein
LFTKCNDFVRVLLEQCWRCRTKFIWKTQLNSMKSLFPSLIPLFLLPLLLVKSNLTAAQAPDSEGIIYVKPTASGSGDGSSWTNATDDLHTAIHVAGVSKVFVSVGTYKVGDHSFIMKNDVEIYGGFDPAAGIDDLGDARILPNSPNFTGGSILDGEDTRPVIWNVSAEDERMYSTAILDGFTITRGAHDQGAGMYNYFASPTLRNLLIRNNIANWHGGAIFNDNSAPTISNTIFLENYAQEGGAIFDISAASSPMVLTNVLFVGNESLYAYGTTRGTGVIDTKTDVTLNNVTMADNYGYAIFISEGTNTIRNSIILDGIRIGSGSYDAQHSLIGGNLNTLNGNVDGVPHSSPSLFTSPETRDYTLRSCSPGINAGSNAFYENLDGDSRDLAGNLRVINGTIDLGAYESSRPVGAPDANGIIYVSTTLSGDGTGNSWANATDNLRAAPHVSGVRQVFVKKGTYQLTSQSGLWPWSWALSAIGGSLVMKNDVAIYGGFDPANGIDDLSDTRILPDANTTQGTLLDGGDNFPCVWNVYTAATPMNSTAVLDGFTLTAGGTIVDGAGINNVFSSPTLRNLIISGNKAAYGAGVFNRSSSPVMHNLLIRNNTAKHYGGGMFNDGSSVPSLTNVKITGNSASHGGGIFTRNSSLTLTNVTVTGNNASQLGGGIYSDDAAVTSLINTTIADNTPSALHSDNTTVSLANSIVYGTTAGNAFTAKHSLIENNNSTADGNIDATGITMVSIFSDAAGGDYTLKAGSVAANAGDNALFPGLDAESKDLAGNARVFRLSTGGVIDVGAYESNDVTLIAPDANGTVYVRTATMGNGTGNSWANATGDLQGAINATDVQKVFVAIGTYNVPSPSSFVMKNNVAVYGGFDPANAIDDLTDPRILPNHGAAEGSVLNGKNERPVIWNDSNGLTATAILDGFTLTAGFSSENGGGIMNASVSPTLKNLVIRGNYATSGGAGMSNRNSSPVISDVIITENTAGILGGGMRNSDTSSPILTNVQITDNTAAAGAGVWCQIGIGNAAFTNVTMAGNAPGPAATIISGGFHLNNSIVYGGIVGSYHSNYSLVEGSAASDNGNLDATGIVLDDLFADAANGNYQLLACSPASNIGDPNVSNLPSKDIAGRERILAGRVDLGAYENNAVPDNPGIASSPAQVKNMQTANGTTAYFNACNELLVSVETTGAAGSIEGTTAARVWIDDTPPAQYVRRHYEITPADNAANASGKVTLYFTQADFDAFNNNNPTAQLPTEASGDVTQLLVEKRGGISADGSGRPNSYPGETETITNAVVIWNSTLARWEVSFQTTGFSGFFIKTTSSPLPVRWISLTGQLSDDQKSILEWKVDQTGVAGFHIERSNNARDFSTIGKVAADNSDGIAAYSFTDIVEVVGTVYYRIRQTDLDGTFAYSRMVKISAPEAALPTAYPNPVQKEVTIKLGEEYIGTQLQLLNASGVHLREITVSDKTLSIDMTEYPAGIYMLYTFNGQVIKLVRN